MYDRLSVIRQNKYWHTTDGVKNNNYR